MTRSLDVKLHFEIAMYTILNYLNFLLLGYCISTAIFMLSTLFLKRFRSLKTEYLNVANLLILVLAVPAAVVVIISYYKNYTAAMQNGLLFPNNRNHFYTSLFLIGVVPLILLFDRLRRKVAVTLIVVASVTWFVLYEQVIILITNFYRDYLPSSWSVYNAESSTPYIFAATIIYFIVAFTLATKRKSNT